MNVLFLVVDDLRPEFNKTYGQAHLVTPHMDKFTESSMAFTRVRQLRHCFRPFLTFFFIFSRGYQLHVIPHAPTYSTRFRCLFHADWGLRSHVMTNSRLQAYVQYGDFDITLNDFSRICLLAAIPHGTRVGCAQSDEVAPVVKGNTSERRLFIFFIL